MPESRCFQDAASERTKFKQIGAMLVKVIDEHDVAVYIALLRIEDPAAIGRHRKPGTEILIHFKDWSYLLAGEIKVSDGSGRLGRNKINTAWREGPKAGVAQARQSVHF